MDAQTIFEKSQPGRLGVMPPLSDVPLPSQPPMWPSGMGRQEAPPLPELSELDVLRHFVGLSRKNYSVDTQFYPLGSCTMKYNPRLNERMAALPGFTQLHPLSDPQQAQGALELMYSLQEALGEITGMEAVTLQPAAGAHGELTALMVMAAYFRSRGEERHLVLVPDSSHGTNPASAALAGFQVVTLPSAANGLVDMLALESHLGPQVACLMLTNPSTLGHFETQIEEICELCHRHGALVYYDGANMNALLGLARPGDMGFDMVHLNLHKTFSTPHGGGGPGSGPVGARGPLVDFLPGPLVAKGERGYHFMTPSQSIGRVRTFWGNFGVLVKAWAYIRHLGAPGLKAASLHAILAANYLQELLKEAYDLPYPGRCMHEFVLSAHNLKAEKGIKALDVAKGLLERGFHAPTVYFPLIVEEALMIEPTETEDVETLEAFAQAMLEIARQETAEDLHQAPRHLPVSRLDEALAARRPVLKM